MVDRNPMSERKAVSLSGELHLLLKAVDGIRELADSLSMSSFEDGAVALSIASGLSLVKERLRLLDRAVRGTVDPWLLWCEENDAVPPLDEGADDVEDVVLRSRSEKRTVRRLRKDLKRAKRRLRREKR
jgi:hypothetical protein